MANVTQKDIAERLGVTRVLVSRALAGHESVAEQTQMLVRETAREMGYHEGSNAGARALAARRNGRPERFGVLACALDSTGEREQLPYWSLLQQGMEDAARAAGYRVILTDAREPQLDGADGLITHGALAVEPTLPHIYVMEGSKSTPGDVTVDNFRGARELTAHLLAQGHRRIACLMDKSSARSVAERVRGWKHELRRAGITPEESWLRNLTLEGGEFLGRGRLNMRAWLKEDWRALGCTALLVQNDRAAIGVMQELHLARVLVPRQVSVAGFDGAGEGAFCTPRLTTVEVPLRLVGQRAVEILLRRIDGQETPGEVLPTALHVDDSTGPALESSKP